jgi:hypothetical protein
MTSALCPKTSSAYGRLKNTRDRSFLPKSDGTKKVTVATPTNGDNMRIVIFFCSLLCLSLLLAWAGCVAIERLL